MIDHPLYNYPQVYRGIGGRLITDKAPLIPAPNMMVGPGEFQRSAPSSKAYRPKVSNVKATVAAITTMDDLHAINAGRTVKITDFQADYWLGEVVY